MCQFGSSSKIISEQNITLEAAIKGYRSWHLINSFNDEEKHLKSININFLWPKKAECLGNPKRDNSEGIYNYNNYYNYNYNNYNNYYYNYYNNYNYYYYNNYNYYYYNNYYICGKTLLYGKVFSYREGYRSSIAIPTHLVILSDKRWFEDEQTKKFAEHFNKIVSDLAKEYGCKIIGYDDFIKGK